jgi:tRNA (cytidine56-2'-O)-methyltransferase
MEKITILRIGHRLGRDERLSTHCGLASRALGAEEIIYSGEEDKKLLESINSINEKWGSDFVARYEKNFRKVIDDYKAKKYLIVHLTMYGLPIEKNIAKIRKSKKVMVIIGSEKVPGEVYQKADMNIAVTNQPHSELAALTIFLHEYFEGKELAKRFNGKIKIIPQERGKKLVGNSQ